MAKPTTAKQLNFALHPGQLEVFTDASRFKVVVAGRRWGKSYMAAVYCITEVLKNHNADGVDLGQSAVFYVAPTMSMAKDIMWHLLKELGQGLIKRSVENIGFMEFINGRRLYIKSADRPDSLRGMSLSACCLDEYATMKPETWDNILSPALSDVEGSALFIGTPAGKNHFYDLWVQAHDLEDWGAYIYRTIENPFMKAKEVEAARNRMSAIGFKQEFEASFQTAGGNLFLEEQFQIGEEPDDGEWFIACDLAGFSEVANASKVKHRRLDESAIACVKVNDKGWFVDDIISGRWGVRETSIKIMQAVRHYRPQRVGIEKGISKNAVMPYLEDQMKRLGVFKTIDPLTHGRKDKTDRITWALQGRLEHGRMTFADKPFRRKLINQALDFPNSMSHDDLLDALAYIDQLAVVAYSGIDIVDDWEPLDDLAGY